MDLVHSHSRSPELRAGTVGVLLHLDVRNLEAKQLVPGQTAAQCRINPSAGTGTAELPALKRVSQGTLVMMLCIGGDSSAHSSPHTAFKPLQQCSEMSVVLGIIHLLAQRK